MSAFSQMSLTIAEDRPDMDGTLTSMQGSRTTTNSVIPPVKARYVWVGPANDVGRMSGNELVSSELNTFLD